MSTKQSYHELSIPVTLQNICSQYHIYSLKKREEMFDDNCTNLYKSSVSDIAMILSFHEEAKLSATNTRKQLYSLKWEIVDSQNTVKDFMELNMS